MTFLMYGAGNIGRGFIGPLFSAAGYEVVFVDINADVVDRLNADGGYTVRVEARPAYDIRVGNVRAVDGADAERVAAEIAGCDVMATSLGPRALQAVAPVIAAGFAWRCGEGRGALDILICENLKDAAHHLAGWIKKELPDGLHGVMHSRLGLVETAIGRMVPVATEADIAEDPLMVRVEEYDFLPVDRTAFRGRIPDVPQLVPHDPFLFFEERKLYLHNMSHSVCAYLGLLAGHEYIWQAMEDTRIRLVVQSAMVEAASMLAVNYGVPFHQVYRHAEDLQYRYRNPALGDTCERVARDPQRKIAAEDRLAAPLRRCAALSIAPLGIAAGLAAALYSLHPGEGEALEALAGVCRLTDKEIAMVMALYRPLAAGEGLEACIDAMDEQRRALRGRNI